MSDMLMVAHSIVKYRARMQTPTRLFVEDEDNPVLKELPTMCKLKLADLSDVNVSSLYSVISASSNVPTSPGQWLDMINRAKIRARDKYVLEEGKAPIGTVWKQKEARKPYSEAQMIQQNTRGDRHTFGVSNELGKVYTL